MIEKFVVQTAAKFAEDAPRRDATERSTWQPITLHGPFPNEEAALHYIKDMHYAGSAGDGTWEYLIDAQAVQTIVTVELDESPAQ